MRSTPQYSGTQELIDGLLSQPSTISPKYFYDAKGSALFEDITRLPEYYPTRTEAELMAAEGKHIARAVGPVATIIELGAGNCEKAKVLCALLRPERFLAVDISAEFLHEAVDGLRDAFPALEVHAFAADLTEDLTVPSDIPAAGRLVFYPGSSIGNFDRPEALRLLSRIRSLLDDDGGLLIGVDLIKDNERLHAAYNDAAGVTAAFNLNVLSHINKVLGSDFDLEQWRHVAFFNHQEARIEMHLEAATDLRVSWPGGHRDYACGERIHTENSYKYDIESFVHLLAHAGFQRTQAWTDQRGWFAAVLARP
jgi:L-histidine Nalpha-methyltransferase